MTVSAHPAPTLTPPEGGGLRVAHSSERKFITILFADMVGSLSAIQSYDPEDAHELLSATVALMADSVHRHGGVVTRTMGDGLLAAFGAPVAQEDHAVRACSAAFAIAEAFRGGGGPTLQGVAVRIGIHSGEVVVGTAVNDFAGQYEITGVAVHIASRIQSLAPPGQALLTAEANALVGGEMRTEFFRRAALKGLDQPVDTFLLLGRQPQGNRAPLLPAGELVGRDDELARLGAVLDDAMGGHGRVLGIVGEPGVGKTTLVRAVLARHCHRARVLLTAAERSTSVVPFHPFRSLLQPLLGTAGTGRGGSGPGGSGTGGAGTDGLKAVRSGLARLGLRDARRLAAIADLFELGQDDAAWRELSPKQHRSAVSRAIADVLLACAGGEPLVVVIEDLQKTDSATLDALAVLGERAAGHRLLILVTFRPDFTPPWAGRPFYQETRLGTLPEPGAEHLARRLLGEAAPAAVVRKISARSKGNPLFLLECVRALRPEGGAGLVGLLALDDALSQTPPTVTAIVAERIDKLPRPVKEALLAASVLGEQFSAGLLAALCGGPDLAASLDFLERSGLVRALDPQRSGFAFVHGLYQEVAYGTMLKRKRRAMHEAAFLALRGSRGAAAVPVESLAQHAFHGGLWSQAVEYCRQAGRRAAHRSAHREAVTHFENAVAALAAVETTETRLRDAIDLRLELRSAYIPLLRLDKVRRVLAECSELARRVGDVERLAKVTAFEAGLAYMTGSPRDSVTLCRRALGLAARLGRTTLHLPPSVYLSQALYGLGRYREAAGILDRSWALFEASPPNDDLGLPGRPLLMAAYWSAIAKAEIGDFPAAEALAGRILEADRVLLPFEFVYAQTAAGFIAMVKGDYPAALHASELALATAEQNDIPFIVPVLATQAGWLLAQLGQPERGLAMAERGVASAVEIGLYAGRSRWCARLAAAALRAGRTETARANVQSARTLAEAAGELGYLCSALHVQGEVALAAGDVDGARRDAIAALEVARSLRLGPMMAKVNVLLGDAEAGAGDPRAARRRWSLAARGFARFGMTSWRGRVLERLR